MIHHPAFPVEPWTIREIELPLDELAHTESLFALSNGHIGLRANLDEGEPFGLPGTYLGGFYETRALPYAEAGFGYPEDGQTVVNVTNGKIIRLLVDDEPFDVRYGQVLHHERVLDLRAGSLRRYAEWVSPTGRGVKITSTRIVSFTHRAVAAIQYEVEPLAEPLRSERFGSHDLSALLVHSTKQSGLRMAAAMDHAVDGPPGTETTIESFAGLARLMITADVAPGSPLRLVKFLAYGWSADRSLPAMEDQVVAALAGARHTGWDGLVSAQRAYLDAFWDGADVELEGDAELQRSEEHTSEIQ